MKIKTQQENQQEKEFELNLSFAEWLDHYSKEPTSKELDGMEKDSKTSSINNKYYQPPQGA